MRCLGIRFAAPPISSPPHKASTPLIVPLPNAVRAMTMGFHPGKPLQDAHVVHVPANNPAMRSMGASGSRRGHGDDRHHVAQAPRPATTLSRFLDSAIILKMSLMAEYLIFPFSDIWTSASFHSSTANLCAHSVFSKRNTHMPSDLDFWIPAPRDRGRSDSSIRSRDFGKTTKLDMVACTQTRISRREINEIDGARVPCNLLHP